MTPIRAILLFVVIAATLPPIMVRADAGHDHAASPASGVAGVGAPRVEAQSELFEIVAVVSGDGMKIFLDRYANNEPVTNAKIDIEGGSLKGSAQANPDGTYSFKHAALTRPGQFPVTFTVVSGSESDLLVGDLVIADPAVAESHANVDPLRQRWSWVAGVVVVLGGSAVAWWLRRSRIKGVAR